MQTYEFTFTASTGYKVPKDEDAEAFLLEWIQETYPEFYDIKIEEVKEVNK